MVAPRIFSSARSSLAPIACTRRPQILSSPSCLFTHRKRRGPSRSARSLSTLRRSDDRDFPTMNRSPGGPSRRYSSQRMLAENVLAERTAPSAMLMRASELRMKSNCLGDSRLIFIADHLSLSRFFQGIGNSFERIVGRIGLRLIPPFLRLPVFEPENLGRRVRHD